MASGRTDVVAQVGRSSYSPKAIVAHDFIAPLEFEHLQRRAKLLIAHCGIGSMFSALQLGQPVIMMPRRHSLGEHRNDHQLATAKQLRNVAGVYIADDEQELRALLDRADSLSRSSPIPAKAGAPFTDALKSLLASLGQ